MLIYINEIQNHFSQGKMSLNVRNSLNLGFYFFVVGRG